MSHGPVNASVFNLTAMPDSLRSFAVRIRFNRWIAPLTFALLAVIACGGTIFSGVEVLAAPGTDLSLQFLAWREFGFSELSHGNLALWNPHLFGGAPYFAGFQSALLYPPNWLHIALPLARAINLLIALHVFAAGYFAYLWCRRRASLAGSILGGMMFMFCGPFFLHVYAGHLPHICAIVWIPLILLAIDSAVETGCATWILLGAIAIAMQILAGHPQYVFYTGIVATIYTIASIAIRRPPHLGRMVVAFVIMYAGAIGLSAIQLFPGIMLATETVRSGGLSYAMAGTFSLPPENVLTLFAPNILGALPIPGEAHDGARQYFGRAYLWETSLFISITGLLIAGCGAFATKDKQTRWLLLGMLLFCVVLGLGRHTPLYWVMYRFMPKYGSFRGTVKFFALVAAFASMLAATGFDGLCRTKSPRNRAIGAAAVAVALALLSLVIQNSRLWNSVLNQIPQSHTVGEGNEYFVDLPTQAYTHFGFIHLTSQAAATRLLCAAAVAALVSAILFGAIWRRQVAFLLLVVAAVELLIFARAAHATAPAVLQLPQSWSDAIARAPRDARFIITDGADINSPMYFRFNGIWGYDPGVLRRYAELLTFSQSGDPSAASQYINWKQPSLNIFRMLRTAAVLQRNPSQPVIELTAPLPVVSLIRNYSVMTDRDEVLRTLSTAEFDPRSRVVLETAPTPVPVKGSSIGSVKVMSSSTDSLEIIADVETPAILLVTNNFSEGWRARPLRAGQQSEYTVQRANWTQQAIALAVGQHHILLEYSPVSFRIGRWISLFSIAGMMTGVAIIYRPRRATE
ncbi:YfhO family protein [soil metagenome]